LATIVDELRKGAPSPKSQRAIKAWQEPDYNYEFAGLMITFKTDIEEKTPGKGSPKSSPKTEMKVIELMMDKPKISTATIGEILGISKRAVLKHTKKLQEKGMLKRIGPARGGHWEITRKEND